MKRLLFLLLSITTLFSSAQVVEKYEKSATNNYGFVVARPTTGVTDFMPCIIHLHGVGGQGDGMSELKKLVDGELPIELQQAAEKYKFVVIAPQVRDWSYNGAISYVRDWAIKNLKVHPDKVHLWGLSAGGSGVTGFSSVSVSNASLFATAVVVCGAGTVNLTGGKNIADAGLPMIFFHATDDGNVPVTNSETSVANINKYPMLVPAKKVIYSGGQHWIWGKVYNPDVKPWIGNESVGLYEWALSCERGKPLPVPEVIPVITLKADAGLDFSTDKVAIVVDGSASTGFESAKWECVSAPNGVNRYSVQACGYKICNVTLPNVQGKYTFRLTVKDRQGAFLTDDVVVTYGSSTQPPTPTKKVVATLKIIVYDDGTYEVSNQ